MATVGVTLLGGDGSSGVAGEAHFALGDLTAGAVMSAVMITAVSRPFANCRRAAPRIRVEADRRPGSEGDETSDEERRPGSDEDEWQELAHGGGAPGSAKPTFDLGEGGEPVDLTIHSFHLFAPRVEP